MAKREGIFIDEERGTYSRTDFRRLKKAEKLELMKAWFRERYEDPQSETPYDSEAGEYIYPWGGPYNAREQLEYQFGEIVPEEWIDFLVGDLESECLEWAPTPKYQDHPDDEPSVERLEIGSEDEIQFRSEVLRQLGVLQAEISRLGSSRGMIGDNHPPVSIFDDATDDLQIIKSFVSVTQSEMAKAVPDVQPIVQNFELVAPVRLRLKALAAQKGELFIDEFVKGLAGQLGKSVGRLVLLLPTLGTLEHLLNLLEHWLRAIGAM